MPDAVAAILESVASAVSLREEIPDYTALAESKVKGRVVENVALCGRESANGRTYTDECLREAVPLYSGVRINIDHRAKRSTGARSFRDLQGRVIPGTEKFDEQTGKIRGDVRVFAGQEGDKLLDIAENDPAAAGFSHDAAGIAKPTPGAKAGHVTVTKIAAVASVDIVTTPATNRSLFESIDGPVQGDTLEEVAGLLEGPLADKVAADEQAARIRRVTWAAESMIGDVLFDRRKHATEAPTPIGTRVKKIQAILADWSATIAKEAKAAKTTAAAGDDDPVTEADMDLATLTRSQLAIGNPTLAEEIMELGRAEVRKELKGVQEELDTAKKTIETTDAAKVLAEGKATIEKKLSGLKKLPEAAKKRIRSACEALLEAGKPVTAEMLDEAIEDSVEMLESLGAKPDALQQIREEAAPKTRESAVPTGDQANVNVKEARERLTASFGRIGGVEPEPKKKEEAPAAAAS